MPRGCTVLYVPFRNHHLICTTITTSRVFQPLPDSTSEAQISSGKVREDPLGDLFSWAATIDMIPYLCVPEALKFREEVFGGEAKIRQFCYDLAHNGGRLMADIFQTEIMDNKTRTLSQCCFNMVQLPLTFGESIFRDHHEKKTDTSYKSLLDPQKGPAIIK